MIRYAKVENGQIVEPFVTGIQIQNRGHNPAIYSKVQFGEKPEINQFQFHKEVLTVKDGQVFANYEVAEKSLDQVLRELHMASSETGEEGDFPDLYISAVDPAVVAHVLEMVNKRVSDKLSDFAKTRDYDSIVSLASYATSTIPKFAAEGQRGVALRDASLAALYQYQMQMVEGTRFVPKSAAEIDSNLPALTWED